MGVYSLRFRGQRFSKFRVYGPSHFLLGDSFELRSRASLKSEPIQLEIK